MTQCLRWPKKKKKGNNNQNDDNDKDPATETLISLIDNYHDDNADRDDDRDTTAATLRPLEEGTTVRMTLRTTVDATLTTTSL